MANRTLKLVIGEEKIGASKMFRQKKQIFYSACCTILKTVTYFVSARYLEWELRCRGDEKQHATVRVEGGHVAPYALLLRRRVHVDMFLRGNIMHSKTKIRR